MVIAIRTVPRFANRVVIFGANGHLRCYLPLVVDRSVGALIRGRQRHGAGGIGDRLTKTDGGLRDLGTPHAATLVWGQSNSEASRRVTLCRALAPNGKSSGGGTRTPDTRIMILRPLSSFRYNLRLFLYPSNA